jgi:hypothetical protein
MAKKKSKEIERAGAEPEASRPYVPGYGIPTSKKGMLSWRTRTRARRLVTIA